MWALLVGTSDSKFLSITTVGLMCVVAFRTAPPIGGLSCSIFSRREEGSDVISRDLIGLTVSDKAEKFRDHCLNRCREI